MSFVTAMWAPTSDSAEKLRLRRSRYPRSSISMQLPRPPAPPHPPGKPRRPYAPRMPPAQRREHLVDAALKVILQHGYGRVSIEGVARAAGVTRPVVYDHFPNLARLLHALVEREERYSLEQLEAVVP